MASDAWCAINYRVFAKEFESFISQTTASFLAKKCNRLFGRSKREQQVQYLDVTWMLRRCC